MLVLSRKVGQRTIIGDSIVVTVLETKGRSVRLGIEAPPDVDIWREEVCPALEFGPVPSEPQLLVAKSR